MSARLQCRAPAFGCKSRFLTSRPWATVVPWGRRGASMDDTDHRACRPLSEEVIAMEIDGFRGQLITADHADYDTARPVWNGAVARRPRLIARCSGTADAAA